MRPQTSRPATPRPGHGTRRSEGSGYLSLALTAVLFLIPFLPRGLEKLKLPVGLAVLALVVGFGVNGITKGYRGGKRAAWLSLTAVAFTMLASAAIEGCRFLTEMTEISDSR